LPAKEGNHLGGSETQPSLSVAIDAVLGIKRRRIGDNTLKIFR